MFQPNVLDNLPTCKRCGGRRSGASGRRKVVGPLESPATHSTFANPFTPNSFRHTPPATTITQHSSTHSRPEHSLRASSAFASAMVSFAREDHQCGGKPKKNVNHPDGLYVRRVGIHSKTPQHVCSNEIMRVACIYLQHHSAEIYNTHFFQRIY